MRVSVKQMSVNGRSFSESAMEILPDDWWQLTENFVVP
jgi:hypothetical protein